MNTLEHTISMIKVLPENDLLEIQKFTTKLFKLRSAQCPFPLKTKEEIYKDLETSRKQSAEGNCQEMGQALREIREKNGL